MRDDEKYLLDAQRASMEARSFVKCGACNKCCHGEIVLIDNRFESPAEYDTEPHAGSDIVRQLRRSSKTGACVYLGPEGCTIYERRPLMCRAFDCVQWLSAFDRGSRRRLLKDKGYNGDLARRALQQKKSGSYLGPENGGLSGKLSFQDGKITRS